MAAESTEDTSVKTTETTQDASFKADLLIAPEEQAVNQLGIPYPLVLRRQSDSCSTCRTVP